MGAYYLKRKRCGGSMHEIKNLGELQKSDSELLN